LIAATEDQSESAGWGCWGIEITGADGTAVGTGEQNTIDIENGYAIVGTAADICANLTLGGKDDWFLPSKDELYKLYLNRVAIGGFDGTHYWSSSEISANNAWMHHFSTDNPYSNAKSATYWVRAVRAF
jgi:hypothetical protein